ncbi:MAG: hypothetical protein JXR76_25720 [Deltaproteobacteria bacterium]|nr:hypothetical protein [Deltaproteobacteria bacterium]
MQSTHPGACIIDIGLWRAPYMGLYVAIRFPLLIFLTILFTALINWMLAHVIGADFSFRQSLLAQLMAFTVAAMILAAIAPITLFILQNTPPISTGELFGHHLFLLINVIVLALAGIATNGRRYQFFAQKTATPIIARQVLVAWLAGNLLVGAQLSWNLRLFIGSPHLAVQFLRSNPSEGNFYESVFYNTMALIQTAQ